MNPIEDRPTPEVDKAINLEAANAQERWLRVCNIARNLERQKAALREALERISATLHLIDPNKYEGKAKRIADEALAATKPNP